jgi:hypothetical protein
VPTAPHRFGSPIGGLAQPLEVILAVLDWVSNDASNSAEAEGAASWDKMAPSRRRSGARMDR